MIPLRDDQPRYSTPYVNYFLIALNVAVFFFELSVKAQSPRGYNALFYEFGIVPSHFTHGFAYHTNLGTFLTIFTSMFLHGGWWHIIGNMWVLWIFGDNIEDQLGHFAYLFFYLLCGLAAGITHILLNAGSSIPTAGASGAIAGIMGAYFLLYPRAKVLTLVPLWWLPAWIVLGYWFLIQFFSGTLTRAAAMGRDTGGIAFWAHVGGFVAGIVLIKVFPQRAGRYRYGYQ